MESFYTKNSKNIINCNSVSLNDFDCTCSEYQNRVQCLLNKFLQTILSLVSQNPQYSREIFVWLKSILDYVHQFRDLLTAWESGGCLDLDCYNCRYTINAKNSKCKNIPS